MLFEFLYDITKPIGYKFYRSSVFSLDEFLRFDSYVRPGAIRVDDDVVTESGEIIINFIPYNELLTIDTTKFSKFNSLGYFLGGNNQNNGTLNMVESVDYRVDTAFYNGDTLVARNNSGCVGTEGTGYIVGGWDQNIVYSSIEKLSYSTNVSSLVPSTTLTENVTHFASFLVSDNFILAGGITSATDNSSISMLYNINQSEVITSTSHSYRINLSTETLQSDSNLPSKRFSSAGIPQTNVTGVGFLIGGYSESLDSVIGVTNDFDSTWNASSVFFGTIIYYMYELIFYEVTSAYYSNGNGRFRYLNSLYGEAAGYVDKYNNRWMNKIRKFSGRGTGRDNPLGLSGRYAVYIGSPDPEGKYSFDKFSIPTTTYQFYQSFISSSIPLLYESIGNGNGSAGYIGGGHTRSYVPFEEYEFTRTESSSIYKLDYITETSSTNSKLSLITARSKMGAFPAVTTDSGHVFANGETNLILQQYVNTTSVSNSGYFVGGIHETIYDDVTATVTRTTKVNFSNNTISTSPSLNPLHPRSHMTSLSDSSFGYFCGGNGSFDPIIIEQGNTSSHFEKLLYSSDLILNDTNLVLSVKTQDAAGVGNLTSGYIVGGRYGPTVNLTGTFASLIDKKSHTTIQKINYKTSLCTSSFGNSAILAIGRAASTGFGNLSVGYIAGGMKHVDPLIYTTSEFFGTKLSSIEKINYASEVVSSLPSNLHTYKTYMSSVGNSTVSYLVGGTQWSIDDWLIVGTLNSAGGSDETIVEKFTYATETLQSVPTLQSGDDYSDYRSGSSGCSNDTAGYIKSGSSSHPDDILNSGVYPSTGSRAIIRIIFSTETKQGYSSLPDPISYTSAACARSNGFPTTGNVITIV